MREVVRGMGEGTSQRLGGQSVFGREDIGEPGKTLLDLVRRVCGGVLIDIRQL